MIKQKNIPELRFSEFKSEWESKKLGDISTWASGGTPPKDNDSYWNGDIPSVIQPKFHAIDY